MRLRKLFYPVISLIFLACVSCSSGSSVGPSTPTPVDDMELIGTWAGYVLTSSGIWNPDNPIDPMNPGDNDNIFVIGIITRNPGVRFIGDFSQFVCLENSLGVYDFINAKEFSSEGFRYYVWDTSGVIHGDHSDDYLATVKNVHLFGSTLFSNDILDGYYAYANDNGNVSPSSPWWEFMLLNYSTAGIYPDVRKLEGTWAINNSFVYGKDESGDYKNTLTLVLDADGAIVGHDTYGNTVTGTIVEIQYDITSDTVPETEIYGVSLTLNDAIDLDGLATYIQTMDSQGIEIQKTLAIGATDRAQNSHHLITGFAKKVEE